jgi:HK97 family phage prohead protease
MRHHPSQRSSNQFVPAKSGSSNRNHLRVEKRAASESKVIRGYGSVFYNAADPGTEYWLWDDIVERVMPGAFDSVLANNPDVRGLFNHDSNYVLGRTTAGTCRLNVDEVGLYYECDESPNDPDWARVAEKINRGDVNGSSYSFVPKSTVWEEITVNDRSVWIRWLKDMDTLYDVGPVTFPAFTAATSSRSTLAMEHPERALLLEERNAFLNSRESNKPTDGVAVRLALLNTENGI